MDRKTRTTFLGVLTILSACAVAAPTGEESIPVVGCISEDAPGPPPSPTISAPPPGIESAIASRLSYYQGAIGPRALGPRGWHCRTFAGPSGFIVIMLPEEKELTDPEQPRVRRHGIVLVELGGRTSGRFTVASHAERFFPDQAPDFVARVKREAVERGSSQQPAPLYPDDTYQKVSDRAVEYTTPGKRDGMGTFSPFDKSSQAVVGRIVLLGPAELPNLQTVSMRLPRKLRALEKTILQNQPGG